MHRSVEIKIEPPPSPRPEDLQPPHDGQWPWWLINYSARKLSQAKRAEAASRRMLTLATDALPTQVEEPVPHAEEEAPLCAALRELADYVARVEAVAPMTADERADLRLLGQGKEGVVIGHGDRTFKVFHTPTPSEQALSLYTLSLRMGDALPTPRVVRIYDGGIVEMVALTEDFITAAEMMRIRDYDRCAYAVHGLMRRLVALGVCIDDLHMRNIMTNGDVAVAVDGWITEPVEADWALRHLEVLGVPEPMWERHPKTAYVFDHNHLPSRTRSGKR
jgi:glyoxylase-like metal-dependent hydrolase (beta-lactamase superfamily II)